MDIIAQLRAELNSVMTKLSELPNVAAGAEAALKQIDADAGAGAAALKEAAAASEAVAKAQSDLATAANAAAESAAAATSANAAQSGSLDNLTAASQAAAGGASALDAAASGAAASVEAIQPATAQAQGGMSSFREEMRQASERTKAFNKEALNGGAALQKIAQYAAAFVGWRTIREGMSAAEESLRATNQLDRAMANLGETSESQRARLLDQAEALQEVTGISDEATIAVQSMLLTLGSTAQETERLTPLVLDMAAALGIDQRSAATLVAKAMAGAGEELSRYGIELDKGKPRIEAMTDTLRRFQGAAKEDVAYPALTRLKSIIGDLLENAGLQGMTWAERFFKGMSDKLAELRERQKQDQEGATAGGGLGGSILESVGSSVGANSGLIVTGAAALVGAIALKKVWEQISVLVNGVFVFLTGAKMGQFLGFVRDMTKELGLSQGIFHALRSEASTVATIMNHIALGASLVASALIGWRIGRLIEDLHVAGRTIGEWRDKYIWANVADFLGFDEWANTVRNVTDTNQRWRESQASLEERTRKLNVALEEQRQKTEQIAQAAKDYQSAINAFVGARDDSALIGETSGARADRLRTDARADLAQADWLDQNPEMKTVGADGQEIEARTAAMQLRASAQQKINEADSISVELRAAGLELDRAESDAYFRTLTLAQQRMQIEDALANANQYPLATPDPAAGDYGAQLETQNARRQRILELESRLREIKDQQLTQLDQEWQTQSAFYTERIANLDTEIEKLRAQNTPEAVAASTRLEATKLEYWRDLTALADTFNQKASAAGAVPVALPDGSTKSRYEAPKNDGIKQSAPSRYEQTRRNYAGLGDSTQHLQTIEEGFGAGIMDSLTRMGTVADQVGETISSSMTTAIQGFGDGIGRSIVYAEDLGEAMQNVGATVVSSVISSGVQMLTQQAMYRAAEIAGFGEAEAAKVEIAAGGSAAREGIMATETGVDAANQGAQVGVHAAGEGAKTGSTLFGSIARGAIRLGETVFHGIQVAVRVALHLAGEVAQTAATIVNAGIRIGMVVVESIAYVIKAAVAAANAVASIPYVGPVLAVVAMAAMLGAGMGLVGQIGKGFREGTPYSWTGDGPEDQVAGLVHNREVVVSAPRVRALGGPSGVERALSGRMVASSSAFVSSPSRGRGNESNEVNFIGYRTPNERRDAIERTRGRVDDIDRRLKRAGI